MRALDADSSKLVCFLLEFRNINLHLLTDAKGEEQFLKNSFSYKCTQEIVTLLSIMRRC